MGHRVRSKPVMAGSQRIQLEEAANDGRNSAEQTGSVRYRQNPAACVMTITATQFFATVGRRRCPSSMDAAACWAVVVFKREESAYTASAVEGSSRRVRADAGKRHEQQKSLRTLAPQRKVQYLARSMRIGFNDSDRISRESGRLVPVIRKKLRPRNTASSPPPGSFHGCCV